MSSAFFVEVDGDAVAVDLDAVSAVWSAYRRLWARRATHVSIVDHVSLCTAVLWVRTATS